MYLIAAFGTGMTGALIYLNRLRISPDAAFSINWTAYTIFSVVIGGLGTLEGPIVGTAVFFLLRELLADYGAWYMIPLGALAVLAMMVYPRDCGVSSPSGGTSASFPCSAVSGSRSGLRRAEAGSDEAAGRSSVNGEHFPRSRD